MRIFYKDMDIWFAYGEDENMKMIAEMSKLHSNGLCEYYDFPTARDLIKNAKIEGRFLRDIWEEMK